MTGFFLMENPTSLIFLLDLKVFDYILILSEKIKFYGSSYKGLANFSNFLWVFAVCESKEIRYRHLNSS